MKTSDAQKVVYLYLKNELSTFGNIKTRNGNEFYIPGYETGPGGSIQFPEEIIPIAKMIEKVENVEEGSSTGQKYLIKLEEKSEIFELEEFKKWIKNL